LRWERKKRELIFVPAYEVCFSGKEELVFVVDGLRGSWCHLLAERPARNETQIDLPFSLSPGKAEEIARRNLRALLFFRILKKAPDKVSSLSRVGYPFWVQYLSRKSRYDFWLLDAMRSTWEEGKVKESVALLFATEAKKAAEGQKARKDANPAQQEI